MTNHTLYKASSAYYNEILAKRGRFLGPLDVTLILGDHSVSVAEYLGDPDVALGTLPEKTDAADLLAFLGY